MNTRTNGNSPTDAIAADQQLARLATVDLNDYAYWANNNGKGISIKVSFPVELKAVLGEHCLGRRTTLADFIRTATQAALKAELTAISQGGVAKW